MTVPLSHKIGDGHLTSSYYALEEQMPALTAHIVKEKWNVCGFTIVKSSAKAQGTRAMELHVRYM